MFLYAQLYFHFKPSGQKFDFRLKKQSERLQSIKFA